MPKDNKKHKVQSPVFKILTGFTISLTLSFAALVMISLLINKESLTVESMPAAVLVVHFLSVFLGIIISGLIFKYATLPDTGIVVVTYIFLYVVISVAFFDGISFRTLWYLLAAAGGGIAALLLYYSLENKTKKPRKRKRSW